MAYDKIVDSSQLETNLTSIAAAIRTKGGTSASLEFPAGFVNAIQAINTGGTEPITGSFTPTSTGTYTLSFGKTISSYIALIEMDETSKASLIASGQSSFRTYFFMLIYPKQAINSQKPNDKIAFFQYYKASDNSVGQANSQITGVSETQLQILVYEVSYAYAYGLIKDYKYNYKIIPLE